MQYRFVRNRTDYLKFLESIREDFKCEKYFEDFFGVKLKCDEETGEILEELREYKGEIGLIPDEFPTIIIYNSIYISDYKSGDSTDIISWLTMKEINNMALESSYEI